MSNPANILVLDIETSPITAYTWGLYDQNIGLEQIQTEWTVLAYCAKWLGMKDIIYEDTGGRGTKNVLRDKPLLRNLWKLLDSADIVIAQNGDRFDIKKINARLIMEGFPPYSPIRVVDTLKVAKRYFGFSSNKLAWMSKHLTETPKSDHRNFPGYELWAECMKDNPKAWEEMKKYNVRDTIACEELYLRLRPWIGNHPNLGVYLEPAEGHACSKCGSVAVQRRGFVFTQQGKYQRFRCSSCQGWSRGKDLITPKETRKNLLV